MPKTGVFFVFNLSGASRDLRFWGEFEGPGLSAIVAFELCSVRELVVSMALLGIQGTCDF